MREPPVLKEDDAEETDPVDRGSEKTDPEDPEETRPETADPGPETVKFLNASITVAVAVLL